MGFAEHKVSPGSYKLFHSLELIRGIVKTVVYKVLGFFKHHHFEKGNMLSYLSKGHIEKTSNSPALQSNTNIKPENHSINSTETAVRAFREIWDEELLGLQENLYAIYLDSNNEYLASKIISTGFTNLQNSDPELILFYADKNASKKIIIAHNHPSGVNKASDSDIVYTLELKEICQKTNVTLFDHIILTNNNHYSFKENHLAL